MIFKAQETLFPFTAIFSITNMSLRKRHDHKKGMTNEE